MPEVNKPEVLWQVVIIESERGWGQKVDEIKYFDNKPEAEQFVREYNSRNTDKEVPDWYMRADGPYKVG